MMSYVCEGHSDNTAWQQYYSLASCLSVAVRRGATRVYDKLVIHVLEEATCA
jgi:hypothetical protein